MLAQQADSEGRVSGAYSWMMPDGGTMTFSSNSKDHNMIPAAVPSLRGHNNNSYLNNNKNFSDRNNHHVPTGQMRMTNKIDKRWNPKSSDPITGAGYMMRIQGKEVKGLMMKVATKMIIMAGKKSSAKRSRAPAKNDCRQKLCVPTTI